MKTKKFPGDAYYRKEIEVENLVAPVHDKHFYYPPLIKKVKERRAKEIANETNGTILDMGCGTGVYLRGIHKENPKAKLYGIDISDGMIREAKKVLPNNIRLEVGNVCKLPYPDNKFDVILMAALIHHLEDKKTAIKEAKRVLKDGGKIIVFDPIKTDSLALKFLHVLFYPLQFICRTKERFSHELRTSIEPRSLNTMDPMIKTNLLVLI